MKNRSKVSRAALAAMVMAVMVLSSVAAEAALQRAPAEPIQRLGEGRMRHVAPERAGVLSAMRRASADWMIRFWDVFDYSPILNVRLRGSR